MKESKDHLTPEKRSWNMSRIRGKDTKPEIAVRKALHAAGYRFRLNVKELPGKPDIVLPKHKTYILIFIFLFFILYYGCLPESQGTAVPANLLEMS